MRGKGKGSVGFNTSIAVVGNVPRPVRATFIDIALNNIQKQPTDMLVRSAKNKSDPHSLGKELKSHFLSFDHILGMGRFLLYLVGAISIKVALAVGHS